MSPFSFNLYLQHVGQRTNDLLQSDLNARMLDLGRERHNTEQLQKSLDAQKESHKELVEIVQKSHLSVLDELTKGGSVLAGVVNTENSIQTKYYSHPNSTSQD